jgi:hypothetical protein
MFGGINRVRELRIKPQAMSNGALFVIFENESVASA